MRLKSIGAAACLSLAIAAMIATGADQEPDHGARAGLDTAPATLPTQSAPAPSLGAHVHVWSAPLSGDDARFTPAQRDLAAAMLLRQAQGMYYAPDQTPQRAARLVALTTYALRFKNDDPQGALLLSQIFEFEGRFSKAAQAMETVLDAQPTNHVLAVRWMQLQLAAIEGAEQRLAFLDSILSGKSALAWVTPALRAEAAVGIAQIYQGQGQRAQAAAAYDKALELDPLLQSALEGQMAIRKQDAASAPAGATTAQSARDSAAGSAASGQALATRAQYLLKLITGNPLDARPPWELAIMLDSMGLHEQSLTFFDFAQTLYDNRQDHFLPSQDFVVAYCNALMDAKQPRAALEKFVGIMSLYPQSADLKAMIVEAYLDLDQVDRALDVITSLEASYLREFGSLPAGIRGGARRPDLLSPSVAASQPAWPASLWHKLPPPSAMLWNITSRIPPNGPASKPSAERSSPPADRWAPPSAADVPPSPRDHAATTATPPASATTDISTSPAEHATAATSPAASSPARTPSPQEAAQLAWFYLMTKRDPQQALAYADLAADAAKDNPDDSRIIAAVHLAADENDAKAIKTLQQLSDQDAYAAAILAAYYYSHNDARATKDILLAGAARTHGGPAFRMIRSIAADHSVQLPPTDAAQTVRLLDGFDDHILMMGKEPHRFIQLSLATEQPAITSADPMEVQATILNKGDLPVPIGDWGLLKPIMSLTVTVTDTLRPSDSQTFSRLPVVSWPAPRLLQPRRKFTCKVRLDIGPLAEFFARHPLGEFQLAVAGTLDPFFENDRMYSPLADVHSETVIFTHGDMLGQFDRDNDPSWNEAYRTLLESIVRDAIKGGDETARISGALKTGALLALAREVETGREKLPKPLQDVGSGKPAVTKPELLTMLRETLKDSSPIVRAHMVASLQYVALDASIVKLLAPVIEDPSPLVRFEVAQVLGSSGLAGQEAVLKFLSSDPDELVRNMANAMLRITSQK